MGKKETFLQIFLVVTAVILLLIAGAGIFWFYQTKIATKPEEVSTKITPTPPVGAVTTPTTILSTPTETEEISDLDRIRQVLANRHSKPVEDANVTIQNNDGEYANGGIVFEGEMGGGWWLAANVDGEWIIVADGNGSVLCADIEGYNFPTSMVPECWDEATNQLIYR